MNPLIYVAINVHILCRNWLLRMHLGNERCISTLWLGDLNDAHGGCNQASWWCSWRRLAVIIKQLWRLRCSPSWRCCWDELEDCNQVGSGIASRGMIEQVWNSTWRLILCKCEDVLVGDDFVNIGAMIKLVWRCTMRRLLCRFEWVHAHAPSEGGRFEWSLN